MIYQVGKRQCLNSGKKWIDINPLESDLIVQPTPRPEFSEPLTTPHPHPPGISNSLLVGVWMFCGTTQLMEIYGYIQFDITDSLCCIYSIDRFLQLLRFEVALHFIRVTIRK